MTISPSGTRAFSRPLPFDWGWMIGDKPWQQAAMQWMLIEGAGVTGSAPTIILPKLLMRGDVAVFRTFVGVPKQTGSRGDVLSEMSRYWTKVVECRSSNGMPETCLFISELDAIQLRIEDRWTFNVVGTPPAIDAFNKVFDKYMDSAPPKSQKLGGFYMLTKRRGSYRFVQVGEGAAEFRPQNYPESVAASFEPMRSWLADPKPFGRLVLMTGPTGTGKTFFIRGLMSQSDVRWVFIPPGLLGDLASPEVVEPLAEFASEDDESRVGAPVRPIALIIEDADSLLLSRSRTKSAQAERLADLSTLLNLGDGMIGSSLNVRIIATCNGSVGKMDSAVLRKGRMFRQIDFPKLTASHASKLIQSETGNGTLCTKRAMTLTDVYGMIRDAEATAPAGE